MDTSEQISEAPEDYAVSSAPDPEVSEARRQLVAQTVNRIKRAKRHWKPSFDRMREDAYFADGNHWEGGVPGLRDPRLVIDITSRHIQMRTSSLYAKNPTIVARRRETMDFLMWDEDPKSLMSAQALIQTIATQGGAADPASQQQLAEAMALLDDVAEGMTRRQAIEKLGKTLEIVFRHQIDAMQDPTFKSQIKALVVRTLTRGVGYVKLDYQRKMGRKPAAENRLDDMRDRLARLQRLLQESADDKNGTYAETRAEYEELQIQMKNFQAEQQVILKEGLLFQFPASCSIIPDTKCTSLDGFVGCDEVAEEMPMTWEDIKETYGVDVRGRHRKYNQQFDGTMVEISQETERDCMAATYLVYNRRTGLTYVVCDGYPDYLKEPATPEVQFQHFWPWFPLIFTRADSDTDPFPRSDVRLMMPLQRELNRTQEALRQHRIAKQPKYLMDASAFEEDEKLNIAESPAHEAIPVKVMADGKKPADMLAVIPTADIDPTVYSTDVIYESVMRVLGSQEANLGGTSRGDVTATESSIAEASRVSSQESNADDLDDLLSKLALNGGQVLLTQMEEETAKKIAGRGAVWLNLTREEQSQNLYLEVEAGSSGRPNAAQDAALIERLMPFILQIPGMSPQKIGAQILQPLTNGRVRVADLMDPSITQSIVNMNRAASPMGAGADPNNAPEQQGQEGGDNAPADMRRAGREQGAQAKFPAAVAA